MHVTSSRNTCHLSTHIHLEANSRRGLCPRLKTCLRNTILLIGTRRPRGFAPDTIDNRRLTRTAPTDIISGTRFCYGQHNRSSFSSWREGVIYVNITVRVYPDRCLVDLNPFFRVNQNTFLFSFDLLTRRDKKSPMKNFPR